MRRRAHTNPGRGGAEEWLQPPPPPRDTARHTVGAVICVDREPSTGNVRGWQQLAKSALLSRGPLIGRNCYASAAFLGVLRTGEQISG